MIERELKKLVDVTDVVKKGYSETEAHLNNELNQTLDANPARDKKARENLLNMMQTQSKPSIKQC